MGKKGHDEMNAGRETEGRATEGVCVHEESGGGGGDACVRRQVGFSILLRCDAKVFG